MLRACLRIIVLSNETVIPLALVGYEMIIANSVLYTSLAIYHLISNACSWNSCQVYQENTSDITDVL